MTPVYPVRRCGYQGSYRPGWCRSRARWPDRFAGNPVGTRSCMTQVKLAVIYYSSTGTLHAMARRLAQAGEKAGAEVRLRHVAELAPPEAIASNAAWSQHFDATKDEPRAAADDVVWADAV